MVFRIKRRALPSRYRRANEYERGKLLFAIESFKQIVYTFHSRRRVQIAIRMLLLLLLLLCVERFNVSRRRFSPEPDSIVSR